MFRTTQARQTLPSFSFVITEPWSKSTVILSHMNVIQAITPPDMAKLQFCPHRTTFKEYRYISHMNVMRTGISPDIAKFQFCHYRTMVKEQCHYHLSHMNVMRTITPRSDINIAKIHFCHQRSIFCALSGLQPRSSKATCSSKLRTAGFISIRYSSIFRLHAQSHSVAAKEFFGSAFKLYAKFSHVDLAYLLRPISLKLWIV